MNTDNGGVPAHAVVADFLSARRWVISGIGGLAPVPAGTSEKIIEELLVYERFLIDCPLGCELCNDSGSEGIHSPAKDRSDSSTEKHQRSIAQQRLAYVSQ